MTPKQHSTIVAILGLLLWPLFLPLCLLAFLAGFIWPLIYGAWHAGEWLVCEDHIGRKEKS